MKKVVSSFFISNIVIITSGIGGSFPVSVKSRRVKGINMYRILESRTR